MGPQNRKSSYDDNNPIDRYQSLTLKQSLSKPSRYICKELSFLLKNGYSKFPKNLQSIIFQDTLFAFSLLPQLETQSAISAANSLLQSAEFAFPKQRRASAVTEYKHAVVASKRKSKTNKQEQDRGRKPLMNIVGVPLSRQSQHIAQCVFRFESEKGHLEPKNRKRCWYNIGSPPPAGSKKVVLKFRSVNNMVIAPASTGSDNKSFAQLPLDVLVSIFSFLDVQSLLYASAVSRSWNVAASENHLWKSLYDTYFHDSEKDNGFKTIGVAKDEDKINLEARITNGDCIDFRFAFKADYKHSGCRKFKSYRGYCSSCCSMVWLNCSKCCNKTNTGDDGNHRIKPMSIQQIVEFILDGLLSSESSSDSDSDAEDSSVFRLWAYPRQKII